MTSNELRAKGWFFDNDAVCRRCGEDIEWWTSPNGNPLPYNPMPRGSSPAVPHKDTCTG